MYDLMLVIGYISLVILPIFLILGLSTAIGIIDMKEKFQDLKGAVGDIKLMRKLPVWWKFRKLQKALNIYCRYDNIRTRYYLFMYEDEMLVKSKLTSYDGYFDNLIEYLKVLKPKKTLEDKERFEILREEFGKVNDHIHKYAKDTQKKIMSDIKSEFKNEIHLLKDQNV
ncbi:hypothetical protein ACOMCU_16325 [Lysinibacillus sp. UGB7]|uniref:hypothetical protein n=1 Tax=Lysinibacillus sp. UGB7 TaxID=3411039 RepID=UPI003B7B39EA